MKLPGVQANPDDSEYRAAMQASHTRVFRERWPDSVEQAMRLISERLHVCLRDKTADNNLEVYQLSQALDVLHRIYAYNNAG